MSNSDLAAEQDGIQAPADFSGEFEVESDADDLVQVPTSAFSPINYSVTTRRISDIFSSYNENELETSPAFQRGYVWDRGKASRLIESVLLHVPLPIVYTAEDEKGRELVIDGQQRLMTFIGYLGNKFPGTTATFPLADLKILKDIKGKTFRELDPKLQIAFRRFGVTVIKISNDTHPDVKFEIFERLNTGAVSLSAQELRNCIFRGRLNNRIKEWASSSEFKRVLAMKTPPSRMIHCEMVLRFLAFSHVTYMNYPGRMKKFMNDFMRDHQNALDERIEEWEKKFFFACDNVYTVFGAHAFRRYKLGSQRSRVGGWENPVNKALFDCVMVSFSRYEKRQIVAHKDGIRERVIDLMVNDQEFADSIMLSTSDPGRVRLRFDRLEATLNQVIKTPSGERRGFTLREKQGLFDRDPTCGFCHQRIEHIDDAEVDHQTRYSDGGSTEPTNARLAHRYCNRVDRQNR